MAGATKMFVLEQGQDATLNPLVYSKARILTSGVGIDFEAIKRLGDYKREDYTYDSSHHVSNAEKQLVPQEVLVSDSSGNKAAVSCVNYGDSSYLLTVIDNELVITNRFTSERLPANVELLRQPPFRGLRTSDGFPVNRIVSNCGLCEVNVWLWHDCAFYSEREACKFCGINGIANQFRNQELLRISDITTMTQTSFDNWWSKRKDYVVRNTLEALTEAMKYDFGGHKHLIFTAGSSIDTDPQWKIYYDIMKAVNEQVVPLSKYEVTMILTPPRDLRLLDRTSEFGAQYAFNMEVFDPTLFAQINPGKARHVTRSHYFETYIRAVELAGIGRVWCGFVLGLEPPRSLLEGVLQLADMGVASGANILHMDQGNTLPRHIRPPSFDTTIKFYQAYGEIIRANGMRPFFCERAMRTSLNHEAFLGLI